MNQQKFSVLKFTVVIVTLFAVTSCVTAPAVPVAAGQPVLIQTKAQIKNEDQTNYVKIEVALLPQKAVRLEISAALGVSVASVVMTPQQITYALHSSRQFVTGPFMQRPYIRYSKKI